MGVQNLLPLVSPVSHLVPLPTFRGKRMGVDGFVWLHRAGFSCAPDLVKNPGTDRIVKISHELDSCFIAAKRIRFCRFLIKITNYI
jgi:hypothetical protein